MEKCQCDSEGNYVAITLNDMLSKCVSKHRFMNATLEYSNILLVVNFPDDSPKGADSDFDRVSFWKMQ